MGYPKGRIRREGPHTGGTLGKKIEQYTWCETKHQPIRNIIIGGNSHMTQANTEDNMGNTHPKRRPTLYQKRFQNKPRVKPMGNDLMIKVNVKPQVAHRRVHFKFFSFEYWSWRIRRPRASPHLNITEVLPNINLLNRASYKTI